MRNLKDFSTFGREAQEMILSQLSAIDLDRIGPKSIATMSKSLIRLIAQSHKFQEEVEDEDIQANWISVREVSLSILESVLVRFQELSDKSEIAEWDRAAVLGVLAEITKVCHEEQKRTDDLIRESAGKEISDELLKEFL